MIKDLLSNEEYHSILHHAQTCGHRFYKTMTKSTDLFKEEALSLYSDCNGMDRISTILSCCRSSLTIMPKVEA